MSLLSRLFGRRDESNGVILLAKSFYNERPLEVVGEAAFQEALDRIAGPKTSQAVDLSVRASLRPERDNKADASAIAVFIAGEQVGYLSRADAAVMSDFLRRCRASAAECRGSIVGGWKRATSEGHFGVKLDVEWPPMASPD